MPNTNRRRVNKLSQALLHFIYEAPTPAQERFLIERLRYRYNIGTKTLRRAIALLRQEGHDAETETAS